jgi:hypothetical protein
MGASPSYPPPHDPHPKSGPIDLRALRGMGPRKCEPKPERLEERGGLRDWFAAWCRRHHMSTRDLSAILGVSVSVAQAKLDGRHGVSLNDLVRFPTRYRYELIHEFLGWCAEHDKNVSHG